MSFSRFRLQNNDLATFSTVEKRQIKDFQTYIMKKPGGFCCMCMKLLYPEEQKFRAINNPEGLPCRNWRLEPLTKDVNGELKYMACSTHWKIGEDDCVRFVYPGNLITSIILLSPFF